MAEKLKDIKDTAADAVEIIRELGTPEVQSSLEKIRETVKEARELLDSMKDPQMVANIENIRRTAESFEKTSSRVESTVAELKSTGLLGEVKNAVASARTTMESVGDTKNMGETMGAIKEMVRAVSGLVDELRLTVATSKDRGTIKNAEEAVRETRQIFSPDSK